MTMAVLLAHADLSRLGGTGLVLPALALGGLLLTGSCYWRGLLRLRRHRQGRRAHRWRPWALVAAVAVGVAATVPPLGLWAEGRMSTHMAQHMVLVLVIAPLIVVGAPGVVLLAGMPSAARRRVVAGVRRLPSSPRGSPWLAWLLHVGALWVWHLPGPYDAAVRSAPVHLLEHTTFLLTAWLFWWQVATPSRRRLEVPLATLYVAAAVPPAAALGAVLTFAVHPLYPAQAAATAALGADPLLDQRIGGLVMWVPMDLGYILVAVLLFGRWVQGRHQADALLAASAYSSTLRGDVALRQRAEPSA